MTVGLQVSRLIDVSVNLSPTGAQFPSVTSAMFVGDSNVINVKERYRSYATINEVALDFGTSAPEYLAALLFFSQRPQPEQLFIGRWASANTAGLLICGPLTGVEQEIANWTAIVDGAFHITVDGGAPVSIVGLDFHLQLTLNGVATIINAALVAAAAGATCVWNGSEFVFTSNTTGAASAVAYLTAGAGGHVDIHNQLMGTLALNAEEVNGIVAETAVECVTLLDDFPTSFYMLMFASPNIVDNDHLAIAAYIEADAIPHIYALTTSEVTALSGSSHADIGYQLQQLKYMRTCYQFSSTTPYAIASMLGRAATIDYEAVGSTITLMYKQEPGVLAETLLSSQANSLDQKNYSYYANFNNGVAIIVNSTMANGFFFDEIQGADWMVGQVQTDLFNTLFTTSTKIPQTNQGVAVLTTTVEGSLAVGIANGQIGPGVWEFDGFGNLKRGDFLEKGYYVFAPAIETQSLSQRQIREAPLISCAVIFAGAVHRVAVLINVQR